MEGEEKEEKVKMEKETVKAGKSKQFMLINGWPLLTALYSSDGNDTLLCFSKKSLDVFRYVFQNRGVSFDHFSRHGSHYRPLYRGNEFEKKKERKRKEKTKQTKKERN